MQSRERVKLEWTSQFELPWFIPKQTMCGVDGAKRMRELCEESKDQLGSMAERLVGEYLNAAQKYCDQFDRQYIASFDGQICVYSETYYARVPPGFDDPATDENEDNESLDCEGIQNFIEFSLHQASMSANKVVWEFLDGVGRFDICKVVVDVDCELFDARPPVRISDPVA